MIIKKAERPAKTIENMRGGTGVITLNHLTTDDLRPKNTRVLSEIIVKPGDSIGAHPHEGESEVYFCMSGQGEVLDNGEYKPFMPGDAQVTVGADPHGIRNTGTEDVHILAVVVLN